MEGKLFMNTFATNYAKFCENGLFYEKFCVTVGITGSTKSHVTALASRSVQQLENDGTRRGTKYYQLHVDRHNNRK